MDTVKNLEEGLLGSTQSEKARNMCTKAWPVAVVFGLSAAGFLTVQLGQTFFASQAAIGPQWTTTPAVDSAERFLVSGLTPSAHQMNRGDCYLFSGTGILEDSYRRFGVDRGWLKPDEFLRLSRQALGIAYMEACKKTPLSWCPGNEVQVRGGTPGSTVNLISWGNTTEGRDGGDEKIFAMLSQVSDIGSVGPLPDAVCPYQPVASVESDWKCDGLKEARKKNPLEFKVHGYKTHFARDDIKRTLREGGKPLALGLGEIKANYYAPCDRRAGCDEATAQCVPCPMERVYHGVSCCVEVERPMVNMKGEWSHQRGEPLIAAGGHAINIVGYNDHYRTAKGYEGGYIVRNTWEDGMGESHGMRARGSHSASYFMQSVGELDESKACPNPHSARSWLPCTDAANCLSAMTYMSAESTNKVLRLKCIDKGLPDGALPKGACEPGDGYYLNNLTEFGAAGLYTACFSRVTGPTTADTRCYPPLTLDDLPLVFGPTDDEIKRVGVNDPDLCGYNFIPYETYETLGERFGDVTATSFEIEWSEQSYAARAKPGFDYSLIKASTKLLKTVPKYTPSQYRSNNL